MKKILIRNIGVGVRLSHEGSQKLQAGAPGTWFRGRTWWSHRAFKPKQFYNPLGKPAQRLGTEAPFPVAPLTTNPCLLCRALLLHPSAGKLRGRGQV